MTEILAAEGLSSADMDQLVVDGWYTKDAVDKPTVEVNGGGQPVRLNRRRLPATFTTIRSSS
ncbi:hypothetical protein [Streptomyces ipomoeae]|uniref:hypothetical protein n=1 Tax=Streptomyces ipomoeae TaxID=103232 RepID=UPI0011467854|nr:hypothetical protein [Streptomyces ipomoeae]MDX2939753.1 hypothetical protein [Streptomyces ipomoeae]TQE20970.1 hypothetical protein SipoB123_26815 [Streptomyces ipomoeae]